MPGLVRLLPGDGGLEQGSPLSVPGRLNLFDFSYADLDGDGTHESIAITQSDRLEVMSAAGGLLWRSEDYFGGTTRYLGGRDASGRETGAQPHEQEQYFVPSRIVVRDLNQNGQPDIVVVRNIVSLSRVFGKLRSYSGGEIHALSWDGSGMSELWRTRRIDGYLADIQLGPDLEFPPREEGAPSQKGVELFVGVVLKSDGFNILTASDSAIYLYPVEYQAPEPAHR